MKKFDQRSQANIAWGLLILVIVLYAVEMSHQVVLRYDTFKATAFDLGNMDQVLWNTIHGRLFQFTNQAIDWYGPPTRLAFHFEPIILPLSLLYVFHADPRILLVFQTLALASGALPVFLLTRRYLREWPILAALMAMAYLLSPALLGVNIFDFHPVALATPLLLYAVLALTYKRYVWFLIACVLAAACKEDVPLTIAVFGILVIWKYKLPRLGVTLMIGGVLWTFLAFKVIMPHFYPGVQANNFWYRYEALGSSPGAAIANILVHPWILFTTFFTLDRLYYLAGLVRSVGFLPLLAPEWLLPTLPGLAINLLSTDPLLYSGVYQYNATIIPFIMIAAIYGTRRLIQAWQGWRHEELPDIVNESGDSDDADGDANRIVGAGLAPALPSTTLPSILPSTTLPSILPSTLPSILPPSTLPSILSPIQRLSILPLSSTLHFIDRGKTLVLVQAGPLIARLQPRILRLTLPEWRNEQWRRFSERMAPVAKNVSVFRLQWVVFAWITVMIGLNFWLTVPQLNSFWADHDPGSREKHIQQLLAMIPPDASVSAGTNLNPHLSERQLLAVFPSVCIDSACNHTVEYVIVDLNSLTTENWAQAVSVLNALSRQFRVVARAEGVVLLIRRST
jgi:uncharacterized membrane protein